MPRVTAAEVRQVIRLTEEAVPDPTLAQHIEVAGRLVDDLLGSKSLSDDRLKDIERYLSAHFSALFNKEAMAAERKVGEAETEYYLVNSVGKYLDLTVWGQTARLLDTSGTLAALSSEDEEISTRKSALFSVFGTSDSKYQTRSI